jgi:hypothetical protein
MHELCRKTVRQKQRKANSMWLLENAKGEAVKVGAKVKSDDGTVFKLVGMRPPHKPESTGKVVVESRVSQRRKEQHEYYPGCFDLKFRHIPETFEIGQTVSGYGADFCIASICPDGGLITREIGTDMNVEFSPDQVKCLTIVMQPFEAPKVEGGASPTKAKLVEWHKKYGGSHGGPFGD